MAKINSKYAIIIATCNLYKNVNVPILKDAAIKCLASAAAYKTAFDGVDSSIQTAETNLSAAKDAAKTKMDASIAAAKALYATEVGEASKTFDGETSGLGNNLASLSSQMNTDYTSFKIIYKADETLAVGVDVNVLPDFPSSGGAGDPVLQPLAPQGTIFQLAKNQTVTTPNFAGKTVRITDSTGLNETIASGSAAYPYAGQLVLVNQTNQLVMVANDQARTVTVYEA